MAKRITVTHVFLEFEEGDKVIAILDSPDAEDLTERIPQGASMFVKQFSPGGSDCPDLLKFYGFENWFYASDFKLHPDTVIKED